MGYYFIYSQMYYYDGSAVLMAHQTCVSGRGKHRKIMESTGSVINAARKFDTKYHGGVFLLEANDVIYVRAPFTKSYKMDSAASFFGALLLRPTDGESDRNRN